MNKSPEVHLRPIEANDLGFLKDLSNDPEVRSRVVGWDWPLSMTAQQRWLDTSVNSQTTRRFVIVVEGVGPVGMTGLWEIDWHNRSAMTATKIGGRPDVRARGYGTAAVMAMMAFAFTDVGLNRLYSTIMVDNEASLALYVGKCGWAREGVLREHVWRNGDYRDVEHVGILAREYFAKFGGGI